jgi:hypothetical protein
VVGDGNLNYWISDDLSEWQSKACAADRYCFNADECFCIFAFYFSGEKINADVQPMAQATGSILVSTILAILLLP